MIEDQTPPSPLLEMRGISKSFPGVRALDGVSLAVAPGEVHALMGENGAGKSTLMKILAGAQTADAGEIRLDGKIVTVDTPQRAMDLGINIIYQELMLVPHLSVAENIFLGREPRLLPGWVDGAGMRRQAQTLMENLGETLDVRRTVGTLSIAQRQMVEIAKATSRRSRVIAMDEPSATLTDHELENLWRLIRQLKSQGIGIVYISHRMEEVFQIADSVTVLRDGRSVGTGSTGDMAREEVLKLMVGRDLDETFPKVPAAERPPHSGSQEFDAAGRLGEHHSHGSCRRGRRAGGPGRVGPDGDRPLPVRSRRLDLRPDDAGRQGIFPAFFARRDSGGHWVRDGRPQRPGRDFEHDGAGERLAGLTGQGDAGRLHQRPGGAARKRRTA